LGGQLVQLIFDPPGHDLVEDARFDDLADEARAAPVSQPRDTEITHPAVAPDEVVAVAPTGLASRYLLTHHPLSVIEINHLSPAIVPAVTEHTDIEIEAYCVSQIGRGSPPSETHSLTEY
jgi:hypothetical protein